MPIPIPGRVADIVRKSTVHVRSEQGSAARLASGSGVVLSPEQVITNAHVIHGTEIWIESWEGATVRSKILKLDRARDLALLSAQGLRSAALPLSDSGQTRAGTPVIAVGNPFGFAGAVSSGVVHSLAQRWICSDVRLAPGNSGGPLADFSGAVLGINTMVAANGLAYSIPSRSVQRFLSDAPHHRLGVVIRAVEFKPSHTGLLILGVVPGSPAERSSLIAGDILAGAGRSRFLHVDDLPAALETVRNGLLQIDFYRGNHDHLRRVTVDLGAGMERSAA